MSTFRLEIDTSNAAFEDLGLEIVQCLVRVATDIANGGTAGAVRDSNGNGVGTFWIEEDE